MQLPRCMDLGTLVVFWKRNPKITSTQCERDRNIGPKASMYKDIWSLLDGLSMLTSILTALLGILSPANAGEHSISGGLDIVLRRCIHLLSGRCWDSGGTSREYAGSPLGSRGAMQSDCKSRRWLSPKHGRGCEMASGRYSRLVLRRKCWRGGQSRWVAGLGCWGWDFNSW